MMGLQEVLERFTGSQGPAGVALRRCEGLEAAWRSAEGPEPSFLAYSLSKSVLAALALRLQEEGKLSLEDTLERWLPSLDHAASIPLRRLLNHSAGIPDYGGLPHYHQAVRTSPSSPWSFERFAEEAFEKGLLFPPGEGWAYSNPGFMLVKRILEEVSGASFAQLVQEEVVKPLGLTRTFLPEGVEDLVVLAPAPSRQLTLDGTLVDTRLHYHPGWVSHGVLASTPSELALLFHALFSGDYLGVSSRREMLELLPVPMPITSGSRWVEPSYGLGVMADPASRWGPLWGHNGGGPGYSASAFHVEELGITIAAMTAGEELEAEEVVFAVLRTLPGHSPTT